MNTKHVIKCYNEYPAANDKYVYYSLKNKVCMTCSFIWFWKSKFKTSGFTIRNINISGKKQSKYDHHE